MKEETITQPIILTLNQVRELAVELQEIGEQAFLVKRNAIKIIDGEIFVLQFEGLKGKEADFGYQFGTDIPYTFWSIVLRQVERYIKKQEEKQRAQDKGLEKIAEEQGL